MTPIENPAAAGPGFGVVRNIRAVTLNPWYLPNADAWTFVSQHAQILLPGGTGWTPNNVTAEISPDATGGSAETVEWLELRVQDPDDSLLAGRLTFFVPPGWSYRFKRQGTAGTLEGPASEYVLGS